MSDKPHGLRLLILSRPIAEGRCQREKPARHQR